MGDVDQIAAVKATLELLTADNESLIEHFQEVTEKLNLIEKMPPGIRGVQFRQLEQSGAFNFKNVDVRHFAHHTARALTPPQFVERTGRRLRNTETLIGRFLEHDEFEGGKELQESLQTLTSEIVDRNDQAAVVKFKQKVDALRETPLFKNYLTVRNGFMKSSPELKDEAELMAAKEAVADGEMMAKDQYVEIKDLEKGVESGEVSPEEAQQKLDEIEARSQPPPEGGDAPPEQAAAEGGDAAENEQPPD